MFVILCRVVVYTYQAEGTGNTSVILAEGTGNTIVSLAEGTGNTSVSLVEVLATPYARVKVLAKPM